MRCRRRNGCGFHSRSNEEWRKRFCSTPNHRNCARFRNASKGTMNPRNLLPTGQFTVTNQSLDIQEQS
jgi:hypothetical protein